MGSGGESIRSLVGALLISTVLCGLELHAQASKLDSLKVIHPVDANAFIAYEMGKKERFTGIFLTLLCPGLGLAYAGDQSAIFYVGADVLLIVWAVNSDGDERNVPIVGLGISRIAEILQARGAVDDYNSSLRSRLGIRLSLGPSRPIGLHLTYRL